MTEILKNLLLPGIGSFTIVDDACVTEEDLQTNFMLPGDSLNKPRGEVLVRELLRLNPDVSSHSCLKVVPVDFGAYDVVVATSDRFRENPSINKLIVVQSVGFYGRVSVFANAPHLVLMSDSPIVHDYRITNPWRELQDYTTSMFAKAEHISHIPFLIQLIKACEVEPVCRENIIRQIDSFGDSSCNVSQEARDNIYLISAMQTDQQVYSRLADISDALGRMDRSKVHLDTAAVLRAVCMFYDSEGVLPLCVNSLPDMTAHSATFADMNHLYKDKYQADLNEVALILQHQSPNHGIDIAFTESILRNLRQIKLAYTNEDSDKGCPEAEITEIMDFLEGKVHGTPTILSDDLKRSSRELHTTSAAIGAVAAQEIIKLVTHKYEPLGNTFILNNGNGSRGTVVRIE